MKKAGEGHATLRHVGFSLMVTCGPFSNSNSKSMRERACNVISISDVNIMMFRVVWKSNRVESSIGDRLITFGEAPALQ